MNSQTSRRDLLLFGSQAALTATALVGISSATVRAEDPKTSGDSSKLWPGYPRIDQRIVNEVVGASHFNEPRVRELVKGYPELVNSCWDWGFGDWETPLGAASHVGHRGIAEFLLTQGARIDIFAAAMLGFTDVVKAFVTLQPGIQRTLGPHGITLLAHAKAGGKSAEETLAYLEKLGDADGGVKVLTLANEDKQKYLGQYACRQPDVKIVCKLNRSEKLVVDVETPDNQSTGRLIHYLGEDAFFPAAVPSVRIRFAVDKEKANTVTISGLAPELVLQRS